MVKFKKDKFKKAKSNFNKLDNRFENLKKIQNVFLNCFFKNEKNRSFFEELCNQMKKLIFQDIIIFMQNI